MGRIYKFLLLLAMLFTGLVYGQSENTKTLKKYWIFFKDKGEASKIKPYQSLSGADLGISPRAMAIRTKVRDQNRLIDHTDLPIASEYINTLKSYNLFPRKTSRWLNGVSVFMSADQHNYVSSLSFVKSVQRIRSLSIPTPNSASIGYSRILNQVYTLDYGESLPQNEQIRVPEVHDLGINGNGVYIGILDTGFDHQNRDVFSDITILGEFDFHWDDGITANQTGDISSQHNHGTETLSVIGGFHEGYLIGPAYGASYALAKTEWLPSETHIEEDHWVSGLEWLVDSMGVDIISCSLGYTTFDDDPDYTYSDLDGNTCVTTVAADAAASRGVIVVNSAGNERQDPWHYVVSPADGDSVIAAGAVTLSGNLASFSSAGPTFDGRIKPDVVALGVGVLAVNPGDTPPYMYVNGTSFSCPLIAGVCALVLQAHPELGPMEVRDAIRETADQSDFPDNEFGWGLVNAFDAVFYHGIVFTNFRSISLPSEDQEILEVDIHSKTDLVIDQVILHYRKYEDLDFQEVFFSPKDEEYPNRFEACFSTDHENDDIVFYIEVKEQGGSTHFGPIGAPEILYSYSEALDDVVPLRDQIPAEFQMYQNFPNPFNTMTIIQFDIFQRTHVKVIIYNTLGQHIMTLLDSILDPGRKRIRWSGIDDNGLSLPSALYFCRIVTDRDSKIRKMILAK